MIIWSPLSFWYVIELLFLDASPSGNQETFSDHAFEQKDQPIDSKTKLVQKERSFHRSTANENCKHALSSRLDSYRVSIWCFLYCPSLEKPKNLFRPCLLGQRDQLAWSKNEPRQKNEAQFIDQQQMRTASMFCHHQGIWAHVSNLSLDAPLRKLKGPSQTMLLCRKISLLIRKAQLTLSISSRE